MSRPKLPADTSLSDRLALSTGKASNFIRKALASQTDDCLLWPFAINALSGYAYVGLRGYFSATHRIVCELAHGPKPTPEHQAAHSCHQRACINPKHLSWKTASENMLDKRQNGTAGRTNKYGPVGKFTSEQVAEIRALQFKKSQLELAAQYGVTPKTIANIFDGKTYRSAGEAA